jgi:hypothetical protein
LSRQSDRKTDRRNELDDELRDIEGKRSDLRETIPRYENLLEKCADV